MMPRGDWKSIAASKLQRMGRRGSAKALYGIGDQNRPPADEMLPSQRREASKQASAAQPCPSPVPSRASPGCGLGSISSPASRPLARVQNRPVLD